MVRLLALVLSALLALPAVGQLQTQPTGVKKMDGSDSTGGGGSGTGWTYDAIEDAWIFTPPSGASDTRILSDGISLHDAAGTDIMAMDATLGATTYVAGRLAADAIEVRGITALSATGTITATNVKCATSGGAVVGTLNADAGNVGRFVYVTRDGANTCTIGVTSGQSLDGVTDGTTTVPSAGWKTFIQTTPTAWVTAGSYPGSGLSGLTATYLPVATSATGVGNSAISHDSTTGVTTFGGSGPYLVLRDMAGTSDSAQLRWDAGNGQVLFRNVGNTGYVNIHASVAVVESVQGPLSLFGYNNDFYAAAEGYQGPSYGYRLRSTGYFSIGSGAANGTMDTFWGRASAGVWGAYTDTSGTLGGIVAANVTGSHFLGGGSAPTVGGSCGTSPTIAGKDAFIKVTTGSGSPTSCEVTFAVAYSTAPVCNANASATTTALNVATTTTTVTVSAAALTAAEVLHISCGSF